MVARSPASRLGILLAALIAASGRSEAGFTIRDLGLIDPGGSSGAFAINASGQAAGAASRADGSTVAVVAGGGQFQELAIPNSTSSFASAIDGAGNVAGSLVDATDRIMHAFSFANDTFQKFGPLKVDGHSGGMTQANGISGGEIVGTGTIPGRIVDGVYTPFPSMTQAAFRGTGPDSVTLIRPLGTGRANVGSGINGVGTVVGTSEISPGGPLHAFVAARDGTVTDVMARNGAGVFGNTEGLALNDRGDVVGGGIVGNRRRAFFASHDRSTLVDLGLLGGTSSVALGVNGLDDPLVVGQVNYGSDPHAFLWRASVGMVDLRTLLSDADQAVWTQLTRATSVNDVNQIAGTGMINGRLHGFLLTPVPNLPLFVQAPAVPAPPASVMVATGCLLVAGAYRLRRGRGEGRRPRTLGREGVGRPTDLGGRRPSPG